MLYQLAVFYLIGVDKNISLWAYIGTTVVIFQNAAILEVSFILFESTLLNAI